MSKRSKPVLPISPRRAKKVEVSLETVPSARISDPSGQVLYFNIIGPSMRPLLKPGDLLFVVPYRGARVRRGDVVVFSPPGGRGLITHRVVSGRGNIWRTCGDNNDRVDPWPLATENIIGKVTHVQRADHPRRLSSAAAGRFWAVLLRGLNGARRQVFHLGRPAYRWAAEHGILRRLIPVRIPLKVAAFSRPGGREFKLLLGGRVIGCLAAHHHRWWIKPPFRLLIDEKRLPQPEHRQG